MTPDILEGIQRIWEAEPNLRFAQIAFQLDLYNPHISDDTVLQNINERLNPAEPPNIFETEEEKIRGHINTNGW